MIFRLSQKLGKNIKTVPTRVLPLEANPFADWSAHLFTADRAKYILLTNTASLYSTVMHGRGISSDSQFLKWGLSRIREFMVDDGQEFIYRRFIAPSAEMVRFSKALNRSERHSTTSSTWLDPSRFVTRTRAPRALLPAFDRV